jgi:hypothetical protein
MAALDYVDIRLWARPVFLIGPAQLRFEGHGREGGHNSEISHVLVLEAAAEAARRLEPAWHTEEILFPDPAARIAEWKAQTPEFEIPNSWLDYRCDLHISPRLRELHDVDERAAGVHLLAATLNEPTLRIRSLPLLTWALRPALEPIPAQANQSASNKAEVQAYLAYLASIRNIYLPHLKPYFEGAHWVHSQEAFAAFHQLDDLSLAALLEVGSGGHLSQLNSFGAYAWPTVLALAGAGWCTIGSCSCLYGGGNPHDIAMAATRLRRLNRDELRIYLER